MNHVFCQLVQIDELEALKIEHPLFSAVLLLQGAQLISFTPKSEPKNTSDINLSNNLSNNPSNNLLWVSDRVEYKQGKPLRGGIPICWPWFGDLNKNPKDIQSQLPSAMADSAGAHGFARNMLWDVRSIKESCHSVDVVLGLSSNKKTKVHWPFEFDLEAHFVFSSRLELELKTTNKGNNSFSFSQALHTYLPTKDIHKTYIHNAHNSRYIDAMDHWQEKIQGGRIGFSAETDRIYFFDRNVSDKKDASDTNYELRVETPSRQLLVKSSNSQSAVIWNPWVKKSQGLSQFKPEDYTRMFCIESANVMSNCKVLKPKQEHRLKLELSQRC